MKYLLPLSLFLLLVSCKSIEPNRTERKVERKNERKANKGILDKDVADILVALADSRLTGIKKAKLAVKKSDNPAFREIGKNTADGEDQMLKSLKKAAKERKITLPNRMGAKNEESYESLESAFGKDFDKKFFKTEKKRIKADRKLLKKAASSGDTLLEQLADTWMPVVENRLRTLKEAK